MRVRVARADLDNYRDAAAVVDMIDMYASGETARGTPLPDAVKVAMVPGLRAQPGALVFLAWADATPVGVEVCFFAYSTFAAKPLLNVHDLAVAKEHRGQGISVMLLNAAEDVARERGCCKLTLEVLEKNERARGVYRKFGFADYQLDPRMGPAMMMEKKLA